MIWFLPSGFSFLLQKYKKEGESKKIIQKYLWIRQNSISLHPQSRDESNSKKGAVVQLVRIHACHAWGHGFESRPHRKTQVEKLAFFLFFY
jgi:hypothetical protein